MKINEPEYSSMPPKSDIKCFAFTVPEIFIDPVDGFAINLDDFFTDARYDSNNL